MSDYINLILNDEQLERLAFNYHDDYYSDIDAEVKIYELINGTGYQQFVFDEDERKVSFGEPLKTVNDLMKRYHSMTKYHLKYYTGQLPQTGQ